MIDGINLLLSLYGNQDNLVKAFLESTLFFPPEIVQIRNNEMIKMYELGEKFPIRYSPSHCEALGIKNKKEAIALTRDRNVQIPSYPSFNIRIDFDGNYENRRLIKNHIGQTISIGKNSTVKNYIISHVWGFATHPLFFSALWNIVLVPAHLNYLMDKALDSHELVKIIKLAIREKCVSLYNPFDKLADYIPEIEEFKEQFIRANLVIRNSRNCNINFLTKEGIDPSKELPSVSISDDEQKLIETLLNRMGNKFFIDYYEPYANEEDLMNVIPVGVYTYNSVKTRINTMKRIFRENLNVKALAYILKKENSRLDDESIEKAEELMKLI